MSSSATLVYGISVDPFKLLYHARAWSDNHVQLAYLNGLISGKLYQNTSSKTALPSEILSMIKQKFWEEALVDSTCECWAFFGDNLDVEIHRPSCCPNAYKAAKRYLEDFGCECGECGQKQGKVTDEEMESMFSEDAYWDMRCDAVCDFGSCFNEPCSRSKSVCFRCRVLHPFLAYHRMHIGHYTSNVWSEGWSDTLHGCIISLVSGKGISTAHDLQGGSHTSIAAVDPDVLRALLDQNADLEKVVKDLALPVVAHPFVQDNTKAQAKKETKVKKKKEAGRRGSTILDPVLYKPRFHLIAGSFCDY